MDPSGIPIHARLFHFINRLTIDRLDLHQQWAPRWLAISFTAITTSIISANRCISPLCRSQSAEYPARNRAVLDFNSNEASERANRTSLPLFLSLSMCVYIYLAPPCAFHACNSSLPLYTRLFASLCINLAWLVVGGEFDEARVNWRFRLSSYCCLVSIKFQRNDCSHRLDEFGRSNMGILSVKRETLREREGYYYRGILIVEIRKEIYERYSF